MKPKYSMGQTVFFMENNKLMSGKITGIYEEFRNASKRHTQYYYSFYLFVLERDLSEDANWIKENNIFPTKKALIDSL